MYDDLKPTTLNVCGLITFIICSWVLLSTLNHRSTASDLSTLSNSTQVGQTVPKHGRLPYSVLSRSSGVILVVSGIQVMSGLITFLGPVQGARDRSKKWLCLNSGLNLALFLVFVVNLVQLQNEEKIKTTMTDLKSMGPQCCGQVDSPERSMTSSLHLTIFFIFVSSDFALHFLFLIFTLLIIRWDNNRDYQLVMMI